MRLFSLFVVERMGLYREEVDKIWIMSEIENPSPEVDFHGFWYLAFGKVRHRIQKLFFHTSMPSHS